MPSSLAKTRNFLALIPRTTQNVCRDTRKNLWSESASSPHLQTSVFLIMARSLPSPAFRIWPKSAWTACFLTSARFFHTRSIRSVR